MRSKTRFTQREGPMGEPEKNSRAQRRAGRLPCVAAKNHDRRIHMTEMNAGHDMQFGQNDDERFGDTDNASLGLIAARRNV
jgi:hypothetical protein